MNNCWSNIKISSYFCFWKLDYYSDMAFLKNIFHSRKTLDGKPFMFFFLNPVNHIEFFSVILKSDMIPGCILLNFNITPIWEILTKPFPVEAFYVMVAVIRFGIKARKYCFLHYALYIINYINTTHAATIANKQTKIA